MNKIRQTCCLLLLTASAVAAPVINEHETFYRISGSTVDDLRMQMNTLSPLDHGQRVDATTSWYVNWRYNWHYDHPSQNPCYVTSVQVTADITYLYPEWINEDDGDDMLQAKWNNYLNQLAAHEQGHANNGRQAAIEIEKSLLNVQPQTSCSALQGMLETTAKNIITQHNAWDVKYDRDTDHGKKQGAIFP